MGELQASLSHNAAAPVQGGLRESSAIRDVMRLLEQRLPEVISVHSRSKTAKEAWCSCMITSFGKLLDEAKVLREKAEADLERERAKANEREHSAEACDNARPRRRPFSASLAVRGCGERRSMDIISHAREFLRTEAKHTRSENLSDKFPCLHQRSDTPPKERKAKNASKGCRLERLALPPLKGEANGAKGEHRWRSSSAVHSSRKLRPLSSTW
jgi:hypothetical protein